VSRGPGKLQRSILHELSQQPSGSLLWRSLRQRYPREVRNKSFYRAVRSLRRMGRILDYEAQRQLRAVAAARGIPLEPSRLGPLKGTSLDTYQRGRAVSD
jgi:hypothetical protein